MAFRTLNILKNIRYHAMNSSAIFLRSNQVSANVSTTYKVNLNKEYKTETDIAYLEDPDCFGTISGRQAISEKLDDEGDIKEEQYLQNLPIKSQKLSIKQYADLIKQYLKHKRIQEAINVLEKRMLKEDRVKPENYIYNILIGACAEVGYTKKAFKLFNDMKRRALKPTGDTYTCLFEACLNSPWPLDGLKRATYLRNLMKEKGIEPNLTNYNVMIKTFGRCSDISTAFKIVDEMKSKKIKIRVHTFNHLLQACISDKESGLKHALIVWRKMLQMREKPNVHSFNLMLKCVKDCNIGSVEDILEVISFIQEEMALLQMKTEMLQIGGAVASLEAQKTIYDTNSSGNSEKTDTVKINNLKEDNSICLTQKCNSNLELTNTQNVGFELKDNHKRPKTELLEGKVNLLSKVVQVDQILALKEIHTVQEKFAIIGGQDDFVKEMEVYSVKPDIKTFTQILPLIENSVDAENKLLETIKTLKIKVDIDFYNMLIKKRCYRHDYDSAFEVKEIIKKENKLLKTHPMNKKHNIKVNIMTYGVLALGCKTREKAEELLNEMKENQIKVNIEILGTLLKHGTTHLQFGYILYIMDIVKEENIRINDIFMKHLEAFNEKCINIIQKNEQEKRESPVLLAAYKRFSNIYKEWLKQVNVDEVLTPEHPWKQFMESHPVPVQRENINIVEPKRFYKRNRKFINYIAKL